MNTEEVAAIFWMELFSEQLDVARFSTLIQHHLGHDGAGLSIEDIMNALGAKVESRWHDVGWACREAFMGFDPVPCESSEEFVLYVALSCLWAESIAHKRLEWDSSFDQILRFACLNIGACSSYLRIRWFEFLFHSA